MDCGASKKGARLSGQNTPCLVCVCMGVNEICDEFYEQCDDAICKHVHKDEPNESGGHAMNSRWVR